MNTEEQSEEKYCEDQRHPYDPSSIEWRLGDEARIATYGGCHWVFVLSIYQNKIATCLSEKGTIEYWGIGSLETRDSYLASCERMRDDWTGSHYREMVALADRPFVKPPMWDQWMANANSK